MDSGDTGRGYFRGALPLADLLNHGGDEYMRNEQHVDGFDETVAWSEITDEEDESEIAFTKKTY